MTMPKTDDNTRQRKIIRILLRKPDASIEDISRTLYGQGFPAARVSTIKTVRRIMWAVLDEQAGNPAMPRARPSS
jgi:hypothetical protein